MSLYLKYRPQVLTDVVGQDHIVRILTNAIAKDKLAHAYLFTGSRGTGKTSTARIIAKHILTKNMTDEVLIKHIHTSVEDGSLVDLIEIDGASNRNIDDIRTLKEQIQFSPVVASAKVYIIDEVHMFTKEAFNALLKTLEEPPSYAFFILATTELHKIPVTIQSRCQTFPFKSVDTESIIQRLQHIADSEKITINREAIRAIAHHVNGGMRDAISLLDQLQSLESIEKEDVYARIGSVGTELAQETWHALTEGDTTAIGSMLQILHAQAVPLEVFVQQLLTIAREKLYTACSAKEPIDWYQFVLSTLLTCLQNMRHSPVAILPVELALLRITQGEEQQTTVRPSVKKEVKAEVPKKAEVKAEVPVATEVEVKTQVATVAEEPDQSKAGTATFIAPEFNLESIKDVWTKVVNALEPASARMSLKNASIQRLEGNTLILAFESQFHRDKVADTNISRTLESLIQEHTTHTVRVRCTEEYVQSANVQPDPEMVDLASAASEIF